jgi:hypothetical protein
MGFDKNDGRPLLQPRRWGTKVNLAMVLGVIVFLCLGILAVGWMHTHSGKAANGIQQKAEDKP